eukprot:CAMPEP_0174250616 /NCGR_PEP_ID=MMETSP0439-20130205/736_1 /TAXON_ID=0 /ORGANISM="Stereomyxa ramosa, Strain Chinc5" /LENGTH=814 /DNA_ID=CAMNT_0015330743 /DNA_START=68 /DNA_END=2513 /DNA_ORIENTATION=+
MVEERRTCCDKNYNRDKMYFTTLLKEQNETITFEFGDGTTQDFNPITTGSLVHQVYEWTYWEVILTHPYQNTSLGTTFLAGFVSCCHFSSAPFSLWTSVDVLDNEFGPQFLISLPVASPHVDSLFLLDLGLYDFGSTGAPSCRLCEVTEYLGSVPPNLDDLLPTLYPPGVSLNSDCVLQWDTNQDIPHIAEGSSYSVCVVGTDIDGATTMTQFPILLSSQTPQPNVLCEIAILNSTSCGAELLVRSPNETRSLHESAPKNQPREQEGLMGEGTWSTDCPGGQFKKSQRQSTTFTMDSSEDTCNLWYRSSSNPSYVCSSTFTLTSVIQDEFVCPPDKLFNCVGAYERYEETNSEISTCGFDLRITSEENTNSSHKLYLWSWTALGQSKPVCVQRMWAATTPQITCPENKVFQCSSDYYHYSRNPYSHPATSEGCYIELLEIGPLLSGLSLWTWQASSYLGSENNTATCVQNITVQDTLPPRFLSCPKSHSYSCDEPKVDIEVFYIENCWENGYTSQTKEKGICNDSQGFTWIYETNKTASDYTSETNCSFLTHVVRHLECPADVVLECTEDWNSSLTLSLPTTNCNEPEELTYVDTFMDRLPTGVCGSTILRTWTAKDKSVNGDVCSSVSCQQKIRLVDTTPPVIVCPQPSFLEAPTGNASFIDVISNLPIVVDNCGTHGGSDAPPPELILESQNGIVNTKCEWTFELTWVAVDACGLSSSCVQIVTFTDTTAPTLSCPPDLTLHRPCGDRSLKMSDLSHLPGVDDFSISDPPTIISQKGISLGECEWIFSLVWGSTDVCGNRAECEQSVLFTAP